MAIIDGGLNTANKANVDANYNLQVRTPLSGVQAGFVTLASEIDPGTWNGGTRIVTPIDASYDSRLRVAIDTPLFVDRLAGVAQNTALYNYNATNNLFAQGNGWASINSSALVAANNYGMLRTYRSFPTWSVFGTTFNAWMQLSQLALTYNTTEWGFGIAPNSIAAPTDGVFFRLTAAGALNCVISSISTGSYQETYLTVANGGTIIGQNITHRFTIKCQSDQATFYIDGNVVALVPRPVAGDFINASSELPVFFRTATVGGIAAAGQIMRISALSVHTQDANTSKPWADIMGGMGAHGSQGQNGGTMGSTASWVNVTNPTTAAYTNAAAPLIAGLGGFGLGAAVLGVPGSAATTTDNLVMGWLNPAGTNAIPGKALYVHGIRIGCINTAVAVTTTPTAIALYLTYGNTQLTQVLANDTANTKKPRAVPLGTMYFPLGAPSGATPQNGDIWMPFTAPIVVNPGEYLSVVARYIIGTATGSELFYFTVGIDSFWE